MSETPLWLQLIDAFEKLVTALGIIIGGCWAYRRFTLHREKETSVDLDMTWECTPFRKDSFLVSFEAVIKNIRNSKVEVIESRNPACKYESETLKYGFELQILSFPKYIATSKPVHFNDIRHFPNYPGIEIDLLSDYEESGKTKYYLEPGDVDHLTTPVVLKEGLYLAILTFLGVNPDEEFWRRQFIINVPCNRLTILKRKESSK